MRAILTYHSVDTTGSPISVSPDEFRAHVRWFVSGTVQVVPLMKLMQIPEETDAVSLTFDDGLASAVEIAVPALQEHGLPATFFIPTSHVGGDNRWEGYTNPAIPVCPIVGWDTLGRLASEDFEIAAHTRTHPRLPTCDDSRLVEELDGADEEIFGKIGLRPQTFAYPYGIMDDRVSQAVARRYKIGCTTLLRVLRSTDPPERLPRLDVWYLRNPGRLQALGSPSLGIYLGLRRFARAIRRTLS